MTEMKTIKDLAVGGSAKLPLLLKEFSIKQTKAQKDYLWAIFTDGTEDIQAQDWDWQSNPSLMSGQKLEKGLVYHVAGQCSEYQCKKQLKLVRMESADIDPLYFAPQGDIVLQDYIDRLNDIIEDIKSMHLPLGELVENVLSDNWKLFTTVPAANGIHHAYVHGLLKHSVDVEVKADAIAQLVPLANRALVKAGAILHDIGKIHTYTLNGAIIEMTEQGQLVEHIMIGYGILEQYRNHETTKLVDMLQHIISSHHGKREYGSPTVPRFIEAMIVCSADGIDAAQASVAEVMNKTEGDWTDKIWTQGNLPFLTPQAIQNRLG